MLYMYLFSEDNGLTFRPIGYVTEDERAEINSKPVEYPYQRRFEYQGTYRDAVTYDAMDPNNV